MSRKLTKLSLVLLASFTVFLPAHAQEANDNGSGSVVRFNLSSSTGLSIPAYSAGVSESVGEDSDGEVEDVVDDSPADRLLCSDLKARGLASGDGVYQVDLDGDGDLAPVSAYCKMHGGRFWTLFADFGRVATYSHAIQGVGMYNDNSLQGKGWTTNVSLYDHTNNGMYNTQDNFIQFLGSGSRKGWIQSPWPEKASAIMVHHHGTSGYSWHTASLSFIGESSREVASWSDGYNEGLGRYEVINNLDFQSHSIRIVEERGIAYIDSIWID